MSNISKSRRKATSLDALALAQNIRSEITTELMLTFGYSEKRLEQHIRKVTDYIQDDALRERAAAQLRETNQDFSMWFIEKERDEVLRLSRGISAHLRAANTISPVNMSEFEERRLQLDKALECCNVLQDELNYIAKVLPADKNKYTRIVLKLEKDFNLIKNCGNLITGVSYRTFRRPQSPNNNNWVAFEKFRLRTSRM